MTNFEILGQLFGVISLIIVVVAYQVKDTRKTSLLMAPGDFFYGLQYYFLGSPSSFYIMLVATLRDLAGAAASDRVMRYVSFFYIGIVWILAFFKAEVPMEYLPPLGTTLATMALVKRDSFYSFRGFIFLHHIVWMSFNIWIMSYAGILQICFTGSSNIIGFLRHHKTKTVPVDL
ncbi:MAG: YgjV family protein [Alphaproteobacteria bacterium]